MPELLLRPELRKKASRMKCRFVIDAAPLRPHHLAIWERELERAKYKAAEWFIQDMEKEGWTYLDKYGFTMKGPFPETVTVTPVKQPKWHIPSRDLIAAVQAGYRFDSVAQVDGAAYNVPLLGETDRWEFELAAVFVREELRIEIPDAHEEREENMK